MVDASTDGAHIILKRTHGARPWAVLTIDIWGAPRTDATYGSEKQARAHVRRLWEGVR